MLVYAPHALKQKRMPCKRSNVKSFVDKLKHTARCCFTVV